MTVLEVARPDRRARRLHGKSDPLDALQAAVTALSGRGLATPKDRDGLVESMRILLTERSSAQGARRGDEPDPCSAGDRTGTDTRYLPKSRQRETRCRTRSITADSRSRPGANPPRLCEATGRGHQQHTSDIDGIDSRLGELAAQVNPALLQLPGVGPLVAGQLLVACGDNPERLGSSSPNCAELHPSPSRRVSISGTGSPGAVTAPPTPRSIASCSCGCPPVTHVPSTTLRDAQRRASPSARSSAASNASSRARFSRSSENPLPVNSGTGRLRQRRRILAIPITTLATALAVPYQRVRRLEIGQRLDPDLAATYSRWLTDREHKSSSLCLADTA